MKLQPLAEPPSRSTAAPGRLARAAAVAAIAAAVGCASATPYRELAASGEAYAESVGTLVDAASALTVDASSERLLQDDALVNTDLAALERVAAEDARRVAVLARLAAHARLLRRYFALLGDLVDGKAGRGSIAAVAAVADALGEAGNALRGVGPAADTGRALDAVRVGAAYYGRALARAEVAQRAPLLGRELATQGEMLAALEAAMRHDLSVVAEARAQRLVVDPLVAEAPPTDPERWLAARRELLLGAPALPELAAATRAAGNLRDAVAAIAQRRPALDALAEVVADAEAIRAALAALGLTRATP